MKTILLENEFIREFTKEFLYRFYDTVGYFNIDAIAEYSAPNIIKRINQLKKYVYTNPDLVDFVLMHEDLIDDMYEYDATEWSQLTKFNQNECYTLGKSEMECFFIVDLFEVTSVPIKYAGRLNKGEYPNGDLFGGEDTDLNIGLNRILLQWAQQKNFEFDFS